MQKTEGVQRATGRGRDEWFALLDRAGVAGKPFREIAGFLEGEHGVSRWWAQKLIVEYEQARGIRPPGVRKDGTFEVSTSKTVAASADEAFTAFVDSRRRRRWLADGKLKLRTSQPGRSARFEWDGGPSRVNVSFDPKGAGKSTVFVAHGRIEGADEAQRIKGQWKERLTELKDFLES